MSAAFDEATLGPDGWECDATPNSVPVHMEIDSSGNPIGLVGPDGQDAGVVLAETDPVTGGITLTPHSSTTETGISIGTTIEQSVEPTGDGDGIHINTYHKSEYNGATGVDLTGAGHVVAGLDHINHKGDGTLVGAYPSEAKLDITGGGTVTNVLLQELQVASNNGTITTLIGNRSTVVANSGTIGFFVGHYFPDHSGVSGITTKRCYQSDDAAAPMLVKAPVIDQSLYSVSPTNGTTETIPDLYSEYVMIPGGTLATLTLKMPANPIDGQEVCIKTTQAITALTHQGNGKSLLDALTTMAAGAYATYRYIGPSSTWYRKG